MALRPNQKAHWIGLAISFHLLKDYKEAVKVLDAFLATTAIVSNHTFRETKEREVDLILQPLTNPPDYEHSEFLLYKIHLMANVTPHKAYETLVANEQYIVDKHTLLTIKAKLLDTLDRRDDSKVIWSELVSRNSDSEEAILGWLGTWQQGSKSS